MDGNNLVTVPAAVIPRMVPEVYLDPDTTAVIRQIDSRSSEILSQLDVRASTTDKPQFAFTVVGFGFSPASPFRLSAFGPLVMERSFSKV
jgi:hypothetical protein